MKKWASTRLAWLVCGLVLVMAICAVALSFPNHYAFGNMSFLIAEAFTAVIGGLVAARQPLNPVGWLILGHAFCFTLGEFGRQYAIYGTQTQPGSLPSASLVIWPTYWIWFPGIVLIIVLLPLYFPNGRLLSSRWKWAVRLAVFCSTIVTVLAMLRPSDDEAPGIPNPLGIGVFTGGFRILALVFEVFAPVSWIVLGVLATTSLILRFRRSGGEERQQMKWVVFAGVAVIFFFAASTVLQDVIVLPSLVSGLLLVATLGTLPAAIAIAILRYRLYDIDIIINRALVYTTLTVVLAAVYFGGVVALQYAFRNITGQETQLAIVASTLIIAALFDPLRGRIQGSIDRLFYRKKYDAVRTLEAFGARLRKETDLDELSGDLIAVVRETVQPKHVSLWMVPAGRPEKGER